MKPAIKISTLCFVLLFLTSCSLLNIKEESEQLENISYISGAIARTDDKYPIYVVLLKQNEAQIEIVKQILLSKNNNYKFDLLPGNYIVAAYIDENKNQLREQDEKTALYSQGDRLYQVIQVNAGDHHIIKKFSIKSTLDISNHAKAKMSLSKSHTNIGKVVSLEDSIFTQENSTLGLWQPLTFLDELGGGLFMLQSYEQGKIPVVFVHGILGNPTEFKKIIKALDKDKYQPWVLYYPSGIQLDLVSNYLLDSLNQLKEKHGFTNIHLITHSMGGLMSRSFLMKHQQQKAEFDISLYITINSPLYGMKDAASGVDASPIIIASWRDLATNSNYIQRVHNWHVPSNIEYHLVFSYLPEEEGDGVVPLSSQLSLSLQDEATKIYGFQAQHAQILMNENFIQRVNKILAKHYQNRY